MDRRPAIREAHHMPTRRRFFRLIAASGITLAATSLARGQFFRPLEVIPQPTVPDVDPGQESGSPDALPYEYRRQPVLLPFAGANRHDRHRYDGAFSVSDRGRRRAPCATASACRPRRLHLGRHPEDHPQGGMAGLDAADRDDRAPALPAALDGGRPRQSARRARDVSRQHGLSHPRHQRARDYRPRGVRRAASAW